MSLYDEYLDFIDPDSNLSADTPAKRIVFGIMHDLGGRRGLKYAVESCDDDIREEIIQAWINIVEAEAGEAVAAAD